MLPQLYLIHRGMAALRSADDQFYQFNSPNFQGNAIITQSRTLHLHDIRDFVQELVIKIEAGIDRLTFNLPQCALDKDVLIHDDPRNRTAHWGFLDHRDNPWAGKNFVLEHILTHPATFNKFAMRREGKVVWKPGPCYEYAKDIFSNLMDICLAIMLTYGAPARGTELLSNLIRNVSGGSIRNIFVLFNEFIQRGSYSKIATAMSADMTMARAPEPWVGRLTVRHLAHLRAIFCIFQDIFHPHMSHNATHYMFAGFSRPVMTRDLSLMLNRLFVQRWHFKRMSVGELRQIIAFFLQRNNIIFQEQELSMAADQMGHSQAMHQEHYGGDKSFPHGWNDHAFQSTALISAKFHILLGFPPTLLHSITAGRERQTQILQDVRAIRQGQYVPPGQEVIMGQTGITAGPALTVPGISRSIMQDVMPTISLDINRAVSQGIAVLADIAFPNNRQTLPADASLITRPPHVSLLNKLREYLLLVKEERPNRGFSNRSQGEVTQLMWQGGINIAYVASTSKCSPFPKCSSYLTTRSQTLERVSPPASTLSWSQADSLLPTFSL